MKSLIIQCLLPTSTALLQNTESIGKIADAGVYNEITSTEKICSFHPYVHSGFLYETEDWLMVSLCLVLSFLSIRMYKKSKKVNYETPKVSPDYSQNLTLLKSVQLIEKDELAKDMYEQNNKLLHSSNVPDETKSALNSLKNNIKSGMVNNAWTEFELIFEKVHPEFFKNLNANYPSLTNNERKLCALILLNLGTREISDISRKSVRSVEVAKYRLTKKMDLPEGKLLYQELMKLS